jgi:hypothetical protein
MAGPGETSGNPWPPLAIRPWKELRIGLWGFGSLVISLGWLFCREVRLRFVRIGVRRGVSEGVKDGPP